MFLYFFLLCDVYVNSDWGENGFIRIAMNVNMCGIGERGFYLKVNDVFLPSKVKSQPSNTTITSTRRTKISTIVSSSSDLDFSSQESGSNSSEKIDDLEDYYKLSE
jgi:hypothetical protein